MSREPETGQVIAHAFLWRHEADRGQEEGAKERPCVIVRVLATEEGERRVFVAPITHTPPQKAERVIEVPSTTKRRLGLDDDRSWIVTRELNHFVWPGFDVRPTPDGRDHFGRLPNPMMRDVREQIAEHVRERRLKMVDRDDEASRTRAAVKPPAPKPPQPLRPKPPQTKPRDASKPRDRDDDITR